MSLVDRAARALAAAQSGSDEWDTLSADKQATLRSHARAVLRALRDPDDRMREAGAEIIRNVGSSESAVAHQSDAANTWRFMIDALMTEN